MAHDYSEKINNIFLVPNSGTRAPGHIVGCHCFQNAVMVEVRCGEAERLPSDQNRSAVHKKYPARVSAGIRYSVYFLEY